MAAAAIDPAMIDWADPMPFYLGNPALAELADVTIKHSGLQLPAHSQVLAVQSAVLADLFCFLRAAPGGKRKRSEEVGRGTAFLRAGGAGDPFSAHSLQEMVFLLRLCYNDADSAALEAALPHLPGIMRLAHNLDAARVLASIDRFLACKLVKQQAALEWVPLAEECQLGAAWAQGVRTLARGVLSGNGKSLWAPFWTARRWSISAKRRSPLCWQQFRLPW
ncbi:hypothetical protein ABPG75_013218 [Micractinium tetrahymenae]